MYDSPHQFEPLLPQFRLTELRERAEGVCQQASQLSGLAHPATRETLRNRIRAMNSYYSNRIEGQGTSALNIERALDRDFSSEQHVAALQRLALAHIEAEKELESSLCSDEPAILSVAFLRKAHRGLYARLVPEERSLDGQVIEPGAVRTVNISVGRHVPPEASSLPRFFDRLDEVYCVRRNRDLHLIATACAHQRMAWVHPFPDGNGRAVRLQTHCALWTLSQGLWSVNRGLARQRDEYYARLATADAPRRGDLDGRGNLTDAGLAEWVDFFLRVCEDQIDFMTQMLDLDDMKRREAAER